MAEREELDRRRRALLDELASVELRLAEAGTQSSPRASVDETDALDQLLDDPHWRAEVADALAFFVAVDLDGRLRFVNHPQPGLEDYRGRDLFEFIQPEHRDAMRRAWQRFDETGLPQHYELEGAGPDGTVSHYASWFYGLQCEGRLVGYVIQSQEVSALRRVEDDLHAQQMRFESLIAHAPDNIAIVDREHRVVFLNRLSPEFDEEAVLGSPIEDIVREADRERVFERIESVFLTGTYDSVEAVVPTPSRDHTFSVRLGPILQRGEVFQVTLIAREVTAERRAASEREDLTAQLHQAQKMEAIGQLTGGVAHDFNNLITVILGNLQLLELEQGTTPEVRELASRASDAARRASALTQRLLAFSRKQALQPRAVDLGQLLEDMGDLLRRALGETIHVTIRYPEDGWPCKVDPAQLENAILNLAINSRDAMPGGGKLELRIEDAAIQDGDKDLSPGEYVRLSVIDNGQGMSAEVLERVYDPFFTTKDVGKGSGLGLSMVYGFVNQSGGNMRIQSEEGHGTTVELLLPRAAEEALSITARRRVGEPRGHDELILVVEDDHAVRSLAVTLLQRLGYRTLEAAEAQSALATLVEEPDIDLLLSDVVLPGGRSGFDLVREAVLVRPHLRVLYCSGYAPDSAGDTGVPPQELRLLEKPYSRAELARAVREALDDEEHVAGNPVHPAGAEPDSEPDAPHTSDGGDET